MTVYTARIERKKGATAKGILLITLCLSSLAWGTNYAPILLEDFEKFMPEEYQGGERCGAVSNSIFLNDTMLFFVHSLNDSEELWRSDGTELGTHRIKELRQRATYNSVFSKFLGKTSTTSAIFVAYNSHAEKYELWCTDGTEENTQCFFTLPGDYVLPQLYSEIQCKGTCCEGVILFNFQRKSDNNEVIHDIWRTEGTAESTCRFLAADYSNWHNYHLLPVTPPANPPRVLTKRTVLYFGKYPIEMQGTIVTQGTAETSLFFSYHEFPFITPDGVLIGSALETGVVALKPDEDACTSIDRTPEQGLIHPEPFALSESPRLLSQTTYTIVINGNRQQYWDLYRIDPSSYKFKRVKRWTHYQQNPRVDILRQSQNKIHLLYTDTSTFKVILYDIKKSKEIVLLKKTRNQKYLDDGTTFVETERGILFLAGGYLYLLPHESDTPIEVKEQWEWDWKPEAALLKDGKLYYRKKELRNGWQYSTWWCTDGTEEENQLFFDIFPPEILGELFWPPQLFSFGGNILLRYLLNNNIYSLILSNGMPGNAHVIEHETFKGFPNRCTVFGDFLLTNINNEIFAYDVDGKNPRCILKRRDVNAANHESFDFCGFDYRGEEGYSCGSNGHAFISAIENKAAITPYVYHTDGTKEGTSLILTARGPNVLLFSLNGIPVFVDDYHIYRANPDGTEVRIIYTFSESEDGYLSDVLKYCYNAKKGIIFTKMYATNTELWTTDGTTEGTRRLATTLSAKKLDMWATDSKVFATFWCEYNENEYKRNIWVYDFDTQTEFTLLDVNETTLVNALGATNKKFFFQVEDENREVQLWQSDGTREGTQLTDLKRLLNLPFIFENGALSSRTYAICNNRLYFQVAYYPVLFESDGTPEGTREIQHFWNRNIPSMEFVEMANSNGVLFYTAVDEQRRATLWKLGPDSDGDGIADEMEGYSDLDGDGTANYMDDDCDGDGILDVVEGFMDRDCDGLIDALDTDSDGDGISDSIEGTQDTNGDGVPDYLDTDSDYDGLSDAEEGVLDTDGDEIPGYLDRDSDGNGFEDRQEGRADIDGDGIPNFRDFDNNGNGVSDTEDGEGDWDQDGIPDFMDIDIDGDGISNTTEGDADPDNDGIPNYLDTDSDGDGASDQTEWQLGANPYDGVSNLPLNPWLLFLALLFLLFILIPKNSRSKDA